MATAEAIKLTGNWLNLNTLSGITEGQKVTIQNVGSPNDLIAFALSDEAPSEGFRGWNAAPYAEMIEIGANQQPVWAKALKRSGSTTASAYIQFSAEPITDSPGGGGVTISPETKSNKTLSTDAWYRAKAVHDNSIIHGMFTFNIPVPTWKEAIDEVEQTSFVNATSVNGKMHLTSAGVLDQSIKLETFRNPRYEPNRGHLYSISAFLPDPTALGERSFGVFTRDSGVMFKLKSGGDLYAVRRTTIGGVVSDIEALIPLQESIDLEKGNTFDIQFEWRGVGDYFFFVNQKLVLTLDILGTLTELSMFNPAAPIAFECINQGEDVVIECGCVDVTSEGGEDNGKSYGSVSVNNDSGQVAVSGFNQPILAVRNKKLFGSFVNTRDVLALLATGYADQRAILRVWSTRDETAITLNDQAYSDFGDAHIERVIYGLEANGAAIVGTPMTFDNSKAELIFGCRIDQDSSYATSALFEGRTEIYQTPGDIFIFTVHRETGAAVNVGATYEFAEAI